MNIQPIHNWLMILLIVSLFIIVFHTIKSMIHMLQVKKRFSRDSLLVKQMSIEAQSLSETIPIHKQTDNQT